MDINAAYKILASKHLKLQERFTVELEEWKPEVPPPTMVMSAFGEVILNYENEFTDKQYQELFLAIESLLGTGEEAVKTAISTGLLETLMHLSNHEKPSRFTSFIGKEATRYCLDWDKFTGAKTPGLYGESMQSRIDVLIKNLKSKDHHMVCKAIDALSEINDIRAVEAILPTLGWNFESDSDCKINFSASAALKRMGEISLLPTIGALKEDPSYPQNDSWRRYWVARSLGIRKDVRVIAPLIEALLAEKNRRVIEGIVDAFDSLAWGIDFGERKEQIVSILKDLQQKYSTEKNYLTNSINKLIKRLGAAAD